MVTRPIIQQMMWNSVENSLICTFLTKNLQNIRSPEKFIDFLAEIDTNDFDIGLFTEKWRDGEEQIVETPGGH